ncbi:adhesion G protein-coupled receptor F5-like isoform X2 [Ambystoma mexicanum]
MNISETILNITSINITTACTIDHDVVTCSCEKGYIWPSNVCSAYPACNRSSTACDCLKEYPSQGCELGITPVTARKMTLKILEEFTQDLNNISSANYRAKKGLLETAFYAAYSSLSGFQSANVNGFRSGSIITDYTVVAAPVSDSALAAANSGVVSNLTGKLNIDPNGFQTVVLDNTTFIVTPQTIFEGDSVTMTCTTSASNSTAYAWLYNGGTTPLSGSRYLVINTLQNGNSVSNLTISKVLLSDGGAYTCTLSDSSYLYEQSGNITVQSLNVAGSNATIQCNNSPVEVFSCCTSGNIGTVAAHCTAAGQSTLGHMTTRPSCAAYSVQATVTQCKVGNAIITYTCVCSTGHGGTLSRQIDLTFVLNATVTIEKKIVLVSATKPFNLTCYSDATDFGSIIWYFGKTVVDKRFYKNTVNATGTTSVLDATANANWNGTTYCADSQNQLLNQSAVIQVCPLPTAEVIQISSSQQNMKCSDKTTVTLTCCYYGSGSYTVTFANSLATNQNGPCYSANYTNPDCPTTVSQMCTFDNKLNDSVQSRPITINYYAGESTCSDKILGNGVENGLFTLQCSEIDKSTVGTITYVCTGRRWVLAKNGRNCVSIAISNGYMKIQEIINSPDAANKIPSFLQNLSATVNDTREHISSSPGDIQKILAILTLVSRNTESLNESVMTSVLRTLDIIVDNDTAWTEMDDVKRAEQSSLLLNSTETFAKQLQFADTINITTGNIILKGMRFTSANSTYIRDFNFSNPNPLSGGVQMSKGGLPDNTSVVTVAYSSLKDIMPVDVNRTVNGLVMSTVLRSNQTMDAISISMTFQKSNSSLKDASCVYWNFTQANHTGGWDTTGCTPVDSGNSVTCNCSHLTSFSILMSAGDSNFTPEQQKILDYITYIGVGISMASLIVCLIIEALVWKSVTKNKTSYMRHVCIANIAGSLLVADIWFIIGSSMTALTQEALNDNTTANVDGACVTATFFTHFFYLSVFFWMFTMGLILFHRMVFIFHHISNTTMLGIAFSLGYACPLVIAVITVAVTQPSHNYRGGISCWLNMTPTMAFLAFVVPALIIVALNFIILIIVIVKLLRPGIGDRPKKEEKGTLVKIAKSVAILTPLLGLTWGFGIGTMSSKDIGIHGTFAALNSLQGLFILVFGTLWDAKIKQSLLRHFSLSRSSTPKTMSTTFSNIHLSKPNVKMPKLPKPSLKIFGKRGRYDVSSAFRPSSREVDSMSYSTLT